jgi:tetratricopeptide (TPR) repeat protein
MSNPRYPDTCDYRGFTPCSCRAWRICICIVILLVAGTGMISCAAAEDMTNVSGTQNSSDLTGLIDTTAADNEVFASELVDRGIRCYREGDYACTWESFETAHSALPGDNQILYIHRYFLVQMKKYDEALQKMDTSLALEPGNADLWYEKGTIENSAGKYAESGLSFNRALALDPAMKISLLQRFPFNVMVKNISAVVLISGFFILGIYIWFNERKIMK